MLGMVPMYFYPPFLLVLAPRMALWQMMNLRNIVVGALLSLLLFLKLMLCMVILSVER